MKRLLFALVGACALVIGCENNPLRPLMEGGRSAAPDSNSTVAVDTTLVLGKTIQNPNAIQAASICTPLQLGDVTISCDFMGSGDGVSPTEWAMLASNTKVQRLIAKANQSLGVITTPKPNRGLVSTLRVTYTRGGVTTSFPVRIYVIQLAGTSARGGTAALLVGRYMDSPLIVPRLIVRPDPSNWTVLEYAYRYNNTVTEMAARFGDCIFRSSLKVLEKKNPGAHTALRARLAQLARPGVPVSDGLRSVYDYRVAGGAVAEMAMSTSVVVAGNIQEEYTGAYISGTYDQIYRVWSTDSPYTRAAKQFARELFTYMFGDFSGSLWNLFRQIFGLEW